MPQLALQTAALLRSKARDQRRRSAIGRPQCKSARHRTSRSSDNRYSGDLVRGGFFGKTVTPTRARLSIRQQVTPPASDRQADEVRISGQQVRAARSQRDRDKGCV